MDERVLARFWSKVDKQGPIPEHRPELGPCWVWTAGRVNGYGLFYLKEGQVKAHRFSYELHGGDLSGGLCACHHCDNPPCVRPEHLFGGSIGKNNADRVAKGRGNTAKGAAHSSSVLSTDSVLTIRADYAAGGITQQALAAKLGVSQELVSAVVRRVVWDHLQEPT